MPKKPGGSGPTVYNYSDEPAYDPLKWLDDLTETTTSGPTTAQSSHSGTTTMPGGGSTNPGDGSQQPGGGGGSYGYGGGGSGSGGAGEGLSGFIQFYRINFFPGGNPPADLLQKAKDNNWTTEYFAQQVRLKDPRYYKSLEAQKILPNFARTMQVLFPGLANDKNLMKSPFYKRIAMWYLKNGVGTYGEAGQEMLYAKITGQKRWKQNNPNYRAYSRNANAAVAAEANPLLFKQLESGMRDIFKEQGVEMEEEYYKSFFRSRYATESGINALSQNLKTLSQARPSAQWFQGRDVTTGETAQVLFGGKQQAGLRDRLSRQFNVHAAFVAGEEKGFGTELDDDKLKRPTI